MASTSINIQPCKIGSSEQHNERTKPLDYVRSELSHLNEHWQSDERTLSQHLSEVQRAYQQAKGKRMHAKSTPIREGVIVIQQSTTMEDLQRFAKACEERWGIKALQIHTHKDEGYMHAKEWTPNLHAHIVWRWTDEEGVTRKLNRFDMVEMQTLLADTLGMERGVASDKKHLSSLQFKNEAEAQRLAEAQNKLQEATKELGEVENVRKKIKEASEASIKPIEAILDEHTTQSLFGGRKTDYEAVIGQIKSQERAKAIVKTSETIVQSQKIDDLERRLELAYREIKSTKGEVEMLNFRHKQELEGIDEDFVRFIYNHPVLKQDKGFEALARNVEEYHFDPMYKGLREQTGRISFSEMLRMWYDKVVVKTKSILLSAGIMGELLLDGLTPEQFLTKEQDNKLHKKEEQKTSRGFRR